VESKRITPLLLLFIAFSYLPAYSQLGIGLISGTVIDSVNAEPVEFAAISIKPTGSNTILTSAMTDSAGGFKFEHIAIGNYQLECSYLGYKNKSIQVSLTKDKPSAQLGKIRLASSAKQLKEAVILSEKPVMKFEAGKMTYEVGKTVTDGAETIMETLQKIPGVSVTQDGDVTVKGKSGIRYLVDGRPSPLADANPEAFMKSISAKNIEKIEVITSPSAKYDASGGGAVINIIMKKGKLEGINGTVSAGIGTVFDKGNVSGNFNYKKNKINFYTNGYYRNEKTTYQGSEQRTQDVENIISQFNSSNSGTNYNQNGGGRIGLDYSPDKYHTFTYSFGGGYNTGQNANTGTQTVSDPNDPTLSLRRFQNSSEYKSMNFSNNLSYRQTWDSADHTWTIDLIHSINKDDRSGLNISRAYDSLSNEIDSLDFYKRTNNGGFNQNFILKTDYSVPLKRPGSKIETGFKEEVNLHNNYNNVYSNIDEQQQLDTLQTNKFNYTQSVTAAYVIYSGSYKKLSYSGGLRWENTYLYSRQSNVDQNYADLFPSGSLGWRFSDNHNMSISYSRRIDRPAFWMLNSTISYSSPYSAWQGNPELQPSFSNNVETNYNATLGKQNLGGSASYSHTDGTFQTISHTDVNQVTYSSMQNAGTRDNAGVFIYTNLKLFRWWDASLSSGYNYHWYNFIQSNVPTHTQGGEAGFWGNTTVKFWKNASFQLNGWGNTGWVEAQKRTKPVGNITATLKKKFFKDKLTVSITCRDIFNTQKWRSTTTTDQLVAHNQYSSETRVGYLTLTYQFGKTTFTPEGKTEEEGEEGKK
jgi:outer membrane receptor protein involved in Fe transport